jgi:hypothetical protein
MRVEGEIKEGVEGGVGHTFSFVRLRKWPEEGAEELRHCWLKKRDSRAERGTLVGKNLQRRSEPEQQAYFNEEGGHSTSRTTEEKGPKQVVLHQQQEGENLRPNKPIF